MNEIPRILGPMVIGEEAHAEALLNMGNGNLGSLVLTGIAEPERHGTEPGLALASAIGVPPEPSEPGEHAVVVAPAVNEETVEVPASAYPVEVVEPTIEPTVEVETPKAKGKGKAAPVAPEPTTQVVTTEPVA